MADPSGGFLQIPVPAGQLRGRTPSESKFLRALNDYRVLCGLVEERGGVILAPEAGTEWVLCPDFSAKILSPCTKKRAALAEEMKVLYNNANVCKDFFSKLDALDARMNNYSLILLLDFRGTRLLLPGDTNLTGYDGIAPRRSEGRPLQSRTPRPEGRRRHGAGGGHPACRCGVLRLQRPAVQQCLPGYAEAAG